ncbi:MAG: hypothetical protein COB93_10670 [Sneathiella sp.]|nr:MAG: hypothetical protein COB93_10670 [Sneathiella sp.]
MTKNQTPYATLPARAFWRTASPRHDIYQPATQLSSELKIATAGSCFAQHISDMLRATGLTLLDAEPAPAMVSPALARRYGYGLYAARYGNIYSARQMLQLLQEAQTGKPNPRYVWPHKDGYVDALRPRIEPEPMASIDEVLALRGHHLRRVAELLGKTDLMILTLGLTEVWTDRATGRAFPICPGICGGAFSDDLYVLLTQSHSEILADLTEILALLRQFQPKMQLMLTLSPVPLSATASAAHVLLASARAKSVLRSAIGEFTEQNIGTSYFPAYEIITQPSFGGPYFCADHRQVSKAGIALVLDIFAQAHGLTPATDASIHPVKPSEDELICDEILLNSFAKPAPAI